MKPRCGDVTELYEPYGVALGSLLLSAWVVFFAWIRSSSFVR